MIKSKNILKMKVRNMLNLKKLEQKVKEALAKETPKSYRKWLKTVKQREKYGNNN